MEISLLNFLKKKQIALHCFSSDWANQVEDAVLFCELDVFETLAGLKDFLALAGARLGTCTHIVLSNNSSWSCDGEMGCSNPTPGMA